MPRILITGVTGFVGTNLVRHFSESKDYSVFGHGRDVEKTKQQFRSSKLEVIKNYSSSILDELKIDGVIHLAGIAHDLSNTYQPEDYYRIQAARLLAMMSEKHSMDEFNLDSLIHDHMLESAFTLQRSTG